MDLDNTIRGLLTSMGVRLPKEPRRWADRVALALEVNEALALALRPLLRLREDLVRSLAELTRRLLAETKGSELCRRLMGVPGVGAITAYVLIEGWRQHYNRVRPHSSLGYHPPAPETVPMARSQISSGAGPAAMAY